MPHYRVQLRTVRLCQGCLSTAVGYPLRWWGDGPERSQTSNLISLNSANYSHASIQSSKATIFSVLNRTAHKRAVSLKRSKHLKPAFTETLPALGQHMMFQTWFLQISSKPRRCLQTGLLAPNNPSLKLGAVIVRFAWSLLFPLLLILTCWLQRSLGWELGLSGLSKRHLKYKNSRIVGKNRELCREHRAQSSGAPGSVSVIQRHTLHVADHVVWGRCHGHSLVELQALLYSSSHMPHMGPHVIRGRCQRELGLREVLIQR